MEQAWIADSRNRLNVQIEHRDRLYRMLEHEERNLPDYPRPLKGMPRKREAVTVGKILTLCGDLISQFLP